MNTIRNLQRQARELREQRQALVAEKVAAAKADAMMTPTERAEYVAGWRRQYTQQFAPKFAAIKDEAAAFARVTKRQAHRTRPQMDPNSAADLVRTEQAWRNVVLPQLAKGRSLADALRNADSDAVLGAERFAPAWLQTAVSRDDGLDGVDFKVQGVPGRNGGKVVGTSKDVDATHVGQAVAGRFAELAGEDGAVITDAVALDAVLPAFERYIDNLSSGTGSAMEIAIGLQMAMGGASAHAADSDEDAA